MKNYGEELVIKIPRVKILNCKRLIFRIGQVSEWRDINSDPDIYPIYSLPKLLKNTYNFDGNLITIKKSETINDLTRELCYLLKDKITPNDFLHTIIFKLNGDIILKYERI